jgi:hypothetical protein
LRVEKILGHNMTIIAPSHRVAKLLILFDWDVVLDTRPWHLQDVDWIKGIMVAGISVDIPRNANPEVLTKKATFIAKMSIPLLVSLYTPTTIATAGFSASANLALTLAGISRRVTRLILIDPLPQGPIPEDLHHIKKAYILAAKGLWLEKLLGRLHTAVKTVIPKESFENHSPDIYREHLPEAVKFIFGDSQ